MPDAEVLAAERQLRNRSLPVVSGLLVLALLCTYLLSRLATRTLVALTREAAEIRALRFDKPLDLRSPFVEIDALAVTMSGMKSTIKRFLEIGAVLAAERHFDRLLETILTDTMQIGSARGGAIYLAEHDGTFRCALARTEEGTVDTGSVIVDPQQVPDHPVARAARDGSVIVQASGNTFTGVFPPALAQMPLSTIAVPLKNRQGEILGVLVLWEQPDAAQGYALSDVMSLVEAVSGTAASAIDTQRLILEQKQLLQSFIELVAEAIDRKSPYIGGHCQRVPELTKMIARAADAETDGPFADFSLDEAE